MGEDSFQVQGTDLQEKEYSIFCGCRGGPARPGGSRSDRYPQETGGEPLDFQIVYQNCFEKTECQSMSCCQVPQSPVNPLRVGCHGGVARPGESRSDLNPEKTGGEPLEFQVVYQ